LTSAIANPIFWQVLFLYISFIFPSFFVFTENVFNEKADILDIMGVWQGVAMDSLKIHLGSPYPTLLCPALPFYALPYLSMPCPTLLRPMGGPPETALWPFQGGWPAAVFYPLGHLTPYAYDIAY